MKSISEVIPGIRNPTEFGTLSTIILKKKKKIPVKNWERCADYLKQTW